VNSRHKEENGNAENVCCKKKPEQVRVLTLNSIIGVRCPPKQRVEMAYGKGKEREESRATIAHAYAVPRFRAEPEEQ